MRKKAVGGGGSFGNDAYQLSIDLLRERASARFAQVGHPDQLQCDVRSETPKPNFRSKKLNFRELDRPSETAPKAKREN